MHLNNRRSQPLTLVAFIGITVFAIALFVRLNGGGKGMKAAPPVPALRTIQAGDRWEYDVRGSLGDGTSRLSVGTREQLTLTVATVTPDASGAMRSRWEIAASHWQRKSKRVGLFRQREREKVTKRQMHRFVQTADGSLRWDGPENPSSNQSVSAFLAPEPFLPPLRSPLAVGQAVDTGTVGLPDSTSGQWRNGRVTYRIEAVEKVKTDAGAFQAYRVAVQVRYDDGTRNTLNWTDWVTGDRLLVKRRISTPNAGSHAGFTQTMTLRGFTPGGSLAKAY